MKQNLQLSASLEDYIEAIYHIISKNEVARGKDIAARLGVSGASVTEALQSLSKKGLINYAPYEVITITAKGRYAAEDVIRRHNALKRFFVDVLAVDNETAEKGACKIEHIAPRIIINRMVDFINYLETCHNGGHKLIREFTEFCGNHESNINTDSSTSPCQKSKSITKK